MNPETKCPARECPDCGRLRIKRHSSSHKYLFCTQCKKGEHLTEEQYQELENLHNATRTKPEVRYRNYGGLADCQQPISERHPDCRGRFVKTQAYEQTISLLCQRFAQKEYKNG